MIFYRFRLFFKGLSGLIKTFLSRISDLYGVCQSHGILIYNWQFLSTIVS